MARLLQAAITAEGRVGLKLNIEKKNLKKILDLLPAITSPTISSLGDDKWVAVETIIEERTVRETLPALRRAGAKGLVEYPLNKVIE